MSRPIVLSNGTLHVGINLYGMVHDFYYPYVGQENHAPAGHMRHRIGVWCEDKFSWLDDGNWVFNMDYEHRALIGHFTAHNEALNVTLEFSDCVDNGSNSFLRDIHVINASKKPREVRLFLHQVFLISSGINGDTAQYLPNEPAILHYKGHRSFVVGAQDQDGQSFEQYSIGVFGIEGKEGVYRDAEDGVLSGNAVDYGKVDSVVGFALHLEALSSSHINYWIAAGRTQEEALQLHRSLKTGGLHERFVKTAAYWHRWLRPAEPTIAKLPKEYQEPFRKSLLIIKSHIDHDGAIIASTDTTMLNYYRDAYAYCWPRDACYALWPLLRLGYKTELKNFFGFCCRVLHPQGFLMHKYMPDGALGASWHPYIINKRIIPPIQEDETAIVIFLLGEYVTHNKDYQTLKDMYDCLVVPTANFMADYIDPQTKLPRASYDLWEEKFGTTTYTVSLVYAALRAAVKMAEKMHRTKDALHWQSVADDIAGAAEKLLFNKKKQYFYKGFINSGEPEGLIYDDTIDASSFFGADMFGLFDPKQACMQASYKTLSKLVDLKADKPTIIPRYEGDMYNSVDPACIGNPWFVTSLWMAQFDVHQDRKARATTTLKWATDLMLQTGVLPEQINPYNQKFLSVAPLIWSQAEYLNAAMDIVGDNHEKD